MLRLAYSSRFKKDYKRFQHNSDLLAEIDKVIVLLLSEALIPEKYQGHPLKGSKAGLKDCHIRPDIVLL